MQLFRVPSVGVVFGLSMALLCSATGFGAQGDIGSIEGLVTEGAGQAVPGVVVELLWPEHTSSTTTITDSLGRFFFRDLQPGRVRIRVVKADAIHEVRATVEGMAPARVTVRLAGTSLGSTAVLAPALGTASVRPRSRPQGSEAFTAESPGRQPGTDTDQEKLPLRPSIVRGADGRLQVRGNQPTENRYPLSGGSVVDPSTSDFAFALPSDAIEPARGLANPFAPEFSRFALSVTAPQIAPGGDHWHLTPSTFVPRMAIRRDGHWAFDIRSFIPQVVVSGPVLRGHLSLTQSVHYRYVDTVLTGLAGEPTLGLRSFDSNTRLDTARGRRHHGTATLAVFPRTLTNAGLNTFNLDPVTTIVRQRGFTVGGTYRWEASPTTLVESMTSFTAYGLDTLGHGGTLVIAPEGNTGSFFNDQRRRTKSTHAAVVVSRTVGDAGAGHLLRVGVDVTSSSLRGTSESRPIEIRRVDGSVAGRITFSTASSVMVTGRDFAAYVEDGWQLSRHLSVEAGVRMDRDGVTRRTGVSPRASAAFTPGGDGRTVLRGGGGVFYRRTPLNVGAFEAYESRSITRYGAPGSDVVVADTAYTHRVNELARARSVVWNAVFDRRISPTMIVRLAHLRQASTHEPIIELHAAEAASALVLESTGRSRYWEQELTLRYVRSARHDVTVSYVLSRARADLNSYDTYFGNVRAPVVLPNAFALAPADAPHRLLAGGTIGIGRSWNVQPTFEARTGFPFTAVNQHQELVGTRNGAGRFPALVSLDLAVERRVHLLGRQVRVGLRLRNALNRGHYRDVQANIDSPTFGQFSNPVERSIGVILGIDQMAD